MRNWLAATALCVVTGGSAYADVDPQITDALLKKGYSEADVRKILGENTLRVLAAAEKVSREMQGAQ